MQISAETLRARLTWSKIIPALRDIFVADVHSPVRHHHFIDVPNEPQATLLLMPAWIEGEYLGVKQVSVFPGNNTRNLPGLTSLYTLSCGKTGQTLAQMDGNVITAIRTAAASALASSYLSRTDSSSLLMMGAGRMGHHLVPAHCSVRDIKTVWIWDRTPLAASEFSADLQRQGIDARVCPTEQLPQVAGEVDIISCATLANEPILLGEWLKPGVHVDLVGSFTPTMREADNTAVQTASIFVDTRAGALAETGDLIIPIKEGAIAATDIQAELTELCGNTHLGRNALPEPATAITLFKSVGDSREDLAAAMLAFKEA
ncbi:ornithine cyclodeaminase family protein [Marinomonas sp. A79]|uniref:Ornithine cyclodeaminase family protein n=1 Tax=Marinomonas vulgaris TaxID=2823372 RepID=A0ABS5HBR1_9GAMM|nr:ornithine cyclodeaminase family protein [Marinomonas vulgaris]MBR7888799.1 ornithine cyclodeaminase family protein [Marinomonas vulgaris]